MGNLIALILKYNPSQLLRMTIYQIPFYYYGYNNGSSSGWWNFIFIIPRKTPKIHNKGAIVINLSTAKICHNNNPM